MGKFQRLIINRFPVGSFLKNVITLMSGTVLAQGLVIICTPLLTRIYTPEDFGVLTIFMAVISVLSVASCGRYELGIVLPEEDGAAANLLVLSIAITLLTTALIILVIILIYWLPISLIINIKKTCISWIWYIPVSLLVTGIYQALNYWATRKKKFGRLAVRQVTQSITMILVQIAIGMLFIADGEKLIIGYITGQTAATVLMLIQTIKEDGSFVFKSYNYKIVNNVAYEYKKFPLYTVGASLLNALSPQLPIFFLSAVSLSATGYFGLATRIVGLPMSLIGSSVAQVFFADASEELNLQGNCTNIFRITVKRLFQIGVIFSVLVFGLSFFMDSIFGSQWGEAGVVLAILIPMFFIRFLSSPVSTIYYIKQRQDWDLYITLIFIIVPIIAFTLSDLQGWTYYIAIAIYSLLMALAYTVQLVLGYRLTNKS
jgi:O-antigen/teichoic acid export membrane protein